MCVFLTNFVRKTTGKNRKSHNLPTQKKEGKKLKKNKPHSIILPPLNLYFFSLFYPYSIVLELNDSCNNFTLIKQSLGLE